ncbi:MAG: hypothetical protein JXB39_06030, partial [Deltaproteobacteria bacterium]|nr:hypothetical protein [Deltaproteobacteria bacterium]
IRNRGPVIERIDLEPALPTTATDLTVAVVARDPDEDHVSITLQWLLDGRPLEAARQHTLPSGRVRRGDVVQVAVEASDGRVTTLGRSRAVRIRNAPPTILYRPGDLSRLDGYRVRASDPDGDALVFRLQDGPPSLSVDPRSGVLRWRGSEAEGEGTYRVGVQVEDPEGAFAFWTFGLEVEAGSGVPVQTGVGNPPEPPRPVSEEEPPVRAAAHVETWQPPSPWERLLDP